MIKLLETPNRKTGYIITSLPEQFHSLIDGYVNMNYSDPIKNELIGHLTSYNIDCKSEKIKEFNNYISDLALNLDAELEGNILELGIDRFWINYQKKNEFNPIHIHNGDYSFVIWWKIPYLIENEKLNFPNLYYGNILSGYFQFFYEVKKNVKTIDLPVDKTWEKTICIFPSDLQHGVLPFYTSDEYRITLSGNLVHDTV